MNRHRNIAALALIVILAVAGISELRGNPAMAARRSSATTPTNVVGTSVVGPPATGVPGEGQNGQPGTSATGQPGVGENVYSTAVTTTVTGPSSIPPTPIPTTKPKIRIQIGGSSHGQPGQPG